MAGEVESQLIESVKKIPYYALQIEETADVANVAQLICYVRYAHGNNIHDDILFCRISSIGEEMLQTLNIYKSDKGTQWEKCVALFSDGDRALTGRHRGVVSRVKEVAPNMNLELQRNATRI
jgi:hypothetical protein